MKTTDITGDLLRSVVSYDPETGAFIRIGKCRPHSPVGTRIDLLVTSGAGAGYRRVKIGGVRFLAHRLAWLFVHGELPAGQIDHINGCPGDNRMANLRDVSRGVNMQNQRAPHRNNKLGVLGVHPDKSRFRSTLRLNGKTIKLGSFPTLAEAEATYLAAKRRLHEGCTI